MRAVVILVWLMACAVSLGGQITATLNHLPDGANEVRIRNDSAGSLVAFVITMSQTPSSAATSRAPLVLYSDPSIEPLQKPLLTGEERVVLARHRVLTALAHPPIPARTEPVASHEIKPICCGDRKRT